MNFINKIKYLIYGVIIYYVFFLCKNVFFGYSDSCVVGGSLRDVGCSDVRGCDNV